MSSSLEYCSNCGKKLPAPSQPEKAEIAREEATALSEEDWPMLRRDASYTGSDNSVVQAPLEKVWEFQAGGDIKSSPIVAYGLVFFGSKDKNIYAVDATTGHIRWIFKTGKSITTSPIAAGGIVYVASNDKNVYAIDAQTGQKHWQFSTGKDICSTPAAGHGLVIFGCKDKQVYALDAQTGQIKWAFKSNYSEHSAPIITEGKVLISGSSFGSRKLYAIDILSGTLLWEQNNYEADPCPFVLGNAVIVRDLKKRLSKIDLTHGTEQGWVFGSPFKSVTVSGGMILAATSSGLCAYNQFRTELAFTGWDWAAIVLYPASAPAVGGDFAFVAGANKLYGIHMRRFMKRWEFSLNEKIESSPVIFQGMVFVASEKRKIHAFRGTKDPRATYILEHVAGEISEKPKFIASIAEQHVSWPGCCCLCCGPVEKRMVISIKSQRMVYSFPNVPYCTSCYQKVKKLFRPEKPGIEMLASTTLVFRNERYWAMFMEANRLR
jgi:outer membrane protein assembly factor BamB